MNGDPCGPVRDTAKFVLFDARNGDDGGEGDGGGNDDGVLGRKVR